MTCPPVVMTAGRVFQWPVDMHLAATVSEGSLDDEKGREREVHVTELPIFEGILQYLSEDFTPVASGAKVTSKRKKPLFLDQCSGALDHNYSPSAENLANRRLDMNHVKD